MCQTPISHAVRRRPSTSIRISVNEILKHKHLCAGLTEPSPNTIIALFHLLFCLLSIVHRVHRAYMHARHKRMLKLSKKGSRDINSVENVNTNANCKHPNERMKTDDKKNKTHMRTARLCTMLAYAQPNLVDSRVYHPSAAAAAATAECCEQRLQRGRTLKQNEKINTNKKR